MVFPHTLSNFSYAVLQQRLISGEWVSCNNKELSGFIFSYAFSSYKEFSFICSDTIIGQISIQWVLFGLEEKLLCFLPSKLAFITLERESVWIKAYQCKSPSPTTAPLQLNHFQVTHCLSSWPLTAITGYSSCVTDCHTPLNLPVHLTQLFSSALSTWTAAFFHGSTLINKKELQ